MYGSQSYDYDFQTVDIIYLDFSKAFHTVSHSLLLKEGSYAWQSRQEVCVMGGNLTDQQHTESGGKELHSKLATYHKWGPPGINMGPNAV